MKITFVLPFAGLQGGIRVVAVHAQRLMQRGHDVFVISSPLDIPLRRKLKSFVLGGEWPGTCRAPSHFDGTSVAHRVLERARPVVDSDLPDADVVVATYYTTAHAVQRLSLAKGAKALFIQGYEMDHGKPNPALDATWRMPMHKIAVSKWLLQLAREKFGDPVVSHVPNGVDLDQFHAPPRSKGPVLTVGLLHSNAPIKGCAVSLKALHRIAEVVPSLRVVAFGAEKPHIGLRLPPFAEFHCRPPQERLRDLYSQCDVWLSASILEGFSLPLLEAMACRCPVVSTRAGGPIDIVDDGVNGYLTDVNDVRGLTDRILRIRGLPQEEWQRMSEAAYRTATSYTWDDATHRFEQALQLAIARHERGDFSAAPLPGVCGL